MSRADIVQPPVLVLRNDKPPTDADVDSAQARIRGLLDPVLLIQLSYQLEALQVERANGGLLCEFNTSDGRVESVTMSRRTHWRRHR